MKKIIIVGAPLDKNEVLSRVLAERGFEVVKDPQQGGEELNVIDEHKCSMTLSAMAEPQCMEYYPPAKQKESWRGGRPR